jgi:hypothetical protein
LIIFLISEKPAKNQTGQKSEAITEEWLNGEKIIFIQKR